VYSALLYYDTVSLYHCVTVQARGGSEGLHQGPGEGPRGPPGAAGGAAGLVNAGRPRTRSPTCTPSGKLPHLARVRLFMVSPVLPYSLLLYLCQCQCQCQCQVPVP